MSLNLDPALQSAYNNITDLKPIISLKSYPIKDDIPFDGNYLTGETTNETKPNIIIIENGRLVSVYIFGDSQIKFVYTDTDKTEFNFVTFETFDFDATWQTFKESSICETINNKIGMIFLTEDGSNTYLRRSIIDELGNIESYALIEQFSKNLFEISSPYVITLSNDTYLLVYIKSINKSLTISGTYSGIDENIYYFEITQDGNQDSAYFKWKKGSGSWSGSILCSSSPQLIAEGLNIAFPIGEYWETQSFYFLVYPAVKSTGTIWINNNLDNGNTVKIGSITYTFKDILTGNPNEIKIDPNMEITLENLRCAIMDDTYEGTGEGIRYGNGTDPNPDVTAVRASIFLDLEAIIPGEDGNNIEVITDGLKLLDNNMTGGEDSTTGDCITETFSRIYKKTSNDFITWSPETNIEFINAGIKQKDNCSLMQENNDDIWLLFDNYDNINWSNCYSSISEDLGNNWNEDNVLTSFDSPYEKALHPIITQMDDTLMYFIFDIIRPALHMDKNNVGWGGDESIITQLSLNEATNKLYAVSSWTGAGTKKLYSITEIDTETWTITNYWNTETVPSFNLAFDQKDIYWLIHHGEGKYIPLGVEAKNKILLAVLNADEDQIKHYAFFDWDEYGIKKNVDWIIWGDFFGLMIPFELAFTYVDRLSDRLYVVLYSDFTYCRKIHIGYIDLTQNVAEGEKYDFTDVLKETNIVSEETMTGLSPPNGGFLVNSSLDFFVISYSPTIGLWKGRTRVYLLSSSGLYKDYNIDVFPDYPLHGLKSFIIVGTKIYGVFKYESLYDEEDKRGLCEINMENDEITFHRPTYATLNEYGLGEITEIGDNKLAIATLGYGIVLFNMDDLTWEIFNNETVPGLTKDGNDLFMPITYESDTGMIYSGVGNSPPATEWQGVVGISQYGILRQSNYEIVEKNGSWSFGSYNPIVQGISDYESSAIFDIDGSLYIFWTNRILTEYSIKWDKALASFDLLPYLLRSQEIVIEENTETDKLNTLSFGLSHGHLFDPFNINSLLRIYVDKGRKIIIKIGARVADIEYFQDLGTFYIKSRSSTGYQRGEYNTISITAEDQRTFINDIDIDATTYYQNYQDIILADILENNGNIDSEDIDIEEFDNRRIIYQQWINIKLLEILKKICEESGYYLTIDIDNKYICKKISDLNPVNHIYEDKDSMINFANDDSWSDLTNQVMVKGEERTWSDVLFAEESIKTLTGTIGWWGQKKDYKVPYSEDLSRTCVDPRLEIVESATNIMFKLAGNVNESISYVDSDNKYCIVTIEAPNLIPLLIAAISSYIATTSVPDGVIVNTATGIGKTVPYGRLLEGLELFTIFYILASIGNFQYVIHAQPKGKERRSIFWVEDDTALQEEMNGKIVRKTIDESLCYTIDQCRELAEYCIKLLQLQRKACKLRKITHLQDEEGDIITIPHLYSDNPMNIFITKLTRRYKMSESPDDNSGYLFDDIEGWVL